MNLTSKNCGGYSNPQKTMGNTNPNNIYVSYGNELLICLCFFRVYYKMGVKPVTIYMGNVAIEQWIPWEIHWVQWDGAMDRFKGTIAWKGLILTFKKLGVSIVSCNSCRCSLNLINKLGKDSFGSQNPTDCAAIRTCNNQVTSYSQFGPMAFYQPANWDLKAGGS